MSITQYLKRFYLFARKIATIQSDTDEEATINNISQAVEFRGINVWILFFAIIIASVGLNVNSTAVIIGAMLISPLMSPIMGVGLAISINDNELLFKSLKNLLVMVLISLIASTFYFFISPLSDAQSELLARTEPTIYDVIIAFVGGLAGIVAGSRRQEKITVVSGVAIATALMPPLCTAGYGLASAQFNYFFGAFYLFFINSFFIALATYVVTRFLSFKKKTYRDAKKELNVRRGIAILTIVAMVPSCFTAIRVIRTTSFNSSVIHFLETIDESEVFADTKVIDSKRIYRSSDDKEIELTFVGKKLTDEQIKLLAEYQNDCDLSDAKLHIVQTNDGLSQDFSLLQAGAMKHFFEDKDRQLAKKDEEIQSLQQQLNKALDENKVSVAQMTSELKILFPNLKSLSVGQLSEVDATTGEEVQRPSIAVEWNDENHDEETEQKIYRWVEQRLKQKNKLFY